MYDRCAINEAHPSSISKPIIICGDFNVAANPIDLANPKANRGNAGYTDEERERFRILLNSGLVDSFRLLHPDEQAFSWWSYRFHAREKNIGWRIDYFLTSESIKNKIQSASIHSDVLGSDHAPVLLEVDI